MRKILPIVMGLGMVAAAGLVRAADDDVVRKAVVFYASFDEAVKGDVGGGELSLSTRFNDEKEKNKFVVEKGFNDKVFRIAKGKGVQGGALEAVDVLPRNGRIFFPAKGNIAFQKGGWSGAVSMWINTDPDKILKTKFCDPVQITQKGANNGGIWFDFNDAKPRDLRMGAFPAIPEGKTGIKEEDADAPMVRVKGVGFKQGDWHHVALSWQNFDTGDKSAHAVLYIDGKRIGTVKDRAIAMDWDIDKAGIYIAVNYIGLIDEFAIFNRPLSEPEAAFLHKNPGLLAGLKKVSREEEIDLRRLVEAFNKERAEMPIEQKLSELLTIPPRRFRRSPLPPTPPKFPFDAETAQRYQKEYAAWRGMPVEITNNLGMKFMLIPPGMFTIGSPAEEPGRNSGGYDETPCSVTLTKPFYLSKHEVTVGQFRRFVEAEKYVTDGEKNGGGTAHDGKAVWKHRPGTQWRKPGYAGPFEMKDEHPVVHISHTDAKAFCAWLQQQTKADGVTYDLPTEAQWEWACRAGSGARYWWGADEDTSGKVANVGDKSLKRVHPEWPRTIMAMDDGHAFPAPVGSHRANAFGLHDMLGNVWEFCSTRYGPYPKGLATDPGDLDAKRGFAVRGGGWSNIAADCRCASRNADPPHFCHSNLGFRVALVLSK